ncbi:MAG: hypothetical protein DMG48_05225 [Acidobacteria bacterium]|nr:MAG: hypothetical protein DMG48_05225 [Acidobacteriota bacterium]
MIKSPSRAPLKVEHTIAQERLEDLFLGRETAREVRAALRKLEDYISVALLAGAQVQPGEYAATYALSRTGKPGRGRLSVFQAGTQKKSVAKTRSNLIVFQPRGAT